LNRRDLLILSSTAIALPRAARAQQKAMPVIGFLGITTAAIYASRIAAFRAGLGETEVHLEGTNRRVDVIAEGFDIAIRVRFPPLAPSDLVMRQLDQSTQCLVASPALVAQALISPADLVGLPSLDLGPPHREHVWQLRHEDGRTATVRHAPRLVTDDMPALRDAAYAGVGVVQLPMMMTWEDLAAGRLVEVLPGWHPPAGIVHATFASRRGLLPSVRVLLDFLVRECAAQRIQADRSLGRGDLAMGDA
jgi:DNA-binding transcriptional LysR family regulator